MDISEKENEKANDSVWRYVRELVPFLANYKARVFIALAFLVSAKVATVSVPLVLRELVDVLDETKGSLVALPIGLLIAYGALRFCSSLFRELQQLIFTRVRYGIYRQVSTKLMRHLHQLSLRFHLERKTGELTRDIDRGTNSIANLLNYLLFNIVPTLLEVGMISAILLNQYDYRFAVVIVTALVLYMGFTFSVTSWRMKFRRETNKRDAAASSKAIDSLLNFETVKYFGNAGYELDRYDELLTEWEDVATQSQGSLSLLNAGQSVIIATGVTLTMILAASEVTNGDMSLGDLVAVNAFLLQLFIPLGFLGTVYSILKNAAADMERMFNLLEREPEIEDVPNAPDISVDEPSITFDHVSFHYDPARPILKDVSFSIPSGSTLAIVGPSGSGKSTIARLLYRFYDIQEGAIQIDRQDIRKVTQKSLRAEIGIVPQDTVLFNDTILHNIVYGKLGSTDEEINTAITLANLTDFIAGLPDGLATMVGERGLKLSGGEKQRVAIARAVLKNPRIIIFDEATSSLDSASEQAIVSAMSDLANARTTITIAHRLSTIVDADQILVLSEGQVMEIGAHDELLENEALYYELWTLQQREAEDAESGD